MVAATNGLSFRVPLGLVTSVPVFQHLMVHSCPELLNAHQYLQ